MTTISPERIAQIEARRDELQALMATGDLPSDRFVAVSKEYAELEPVAQAAGEVRRLLLDHLQDHYALYGEFTGVRSARKHIGWYVRGLPGGESFRASMNDIEDGAAQLRAVGAYFDGLAASHGDRLPVGVEAQEQSEEQDA